MLKRLSGIALAIIGAFALGGIALHRHEPINALWILVASACIYTLGYRFYAAWITARVLTVDPSRAQSNAPASARRIQPWHASSPRSAGRNGQAVN